MVRDHSNVKWDLQRGQELSNHKGSITCVVFCSEPCDMCDKKGGRRKELGEVGEKRNRRKRRCTR